MLDNIIRLDMIEKLYSGNLDEPSLAADDKPPSKMCNSKEDCNSVECLRNTCSRIGILFYRFEGLPKFGNLLYIDGDIIYT